MKTKRIVRVIVSVLILTASSAMADTIARWVDEDGVTHFGNRQFAPPGAETIKLDAANGMDPPAATATGRSSNGPHWTKLTLPRKQNPKGWRSRHDSLYTGRKHQTNRRRH
jgi:hypothetical protein